MIKPSKTIEYQRRINFLLNEHFSTIGRMVPNKNDGEEIVDTIAEKCNFNEKQFLSSCVYIRDCPGWVLHCSPKANGHLIVFGSSWGNQLEEAGHFYRKITVIEPLPSNRLYLQERFINNTNCSYQFLSEVKFDKEITSYTPDAIDTVLIRGDFLNGIKTKKLKAYLVRCKPFLKTNGEILIETCGLLKNWRKKAFDEPSVKQWQGFLDNTLDLSTESYRLTGVHWFAGGYFENKAARDADRKCASNSKTLVNKLGRYLLSELTYRLPALMPVDHLLVGRLQNHVKTALTSAGELISTSISIDETCPSTGFTLTRRGFAMPYMDSNTDRIIRIPLSDTARYRCNKSHAILKHLNQTLPPSISRALPTSEKNPLDGFEIYAEEKLPGQPGPATLSRSCFDESLCWLADFQRATYKVIKSPAEDGAEAILRRIDQLVQLSESIISHYGNASHATAWESVKPYVLSVPWQTGIALCASHGDFNPTNLLFSNDTLSGVIDWETGVSLSFPGRDLYWFILYNKIGKNKAITVSEYKKTILNRSLNETVSVYVNRVNNEILATVQHPWSKIIYPLERMQSMWDGYELKGVIFDGRIWLDYLLILDDYIKQPMMKGAYS